MVEFKVVVSDPKSGRAKQIVVSGENAEVFIGKKIGDIVAGTAVGLDEGYLLKIRGGTDKDGFPMRPDIPGTKRVKILLSGGPGFRTKGKRKYGSEKKKVDVEKGERRKKTVRGNTIAEDIAQINVVIVKYGSTPIEEWMKPEKQEGESQQSS